MTVYIIYVFIGVSLYHLRFGVVSVYIIYVWNSVSLYRLRLNWCQFALSTFGLVVFNIIYCLYWCLSISFTLGVMSVYFIYVWISVSLYCLRLHWCQLIPSTSGLGSINIIYAWTGVSLHHVRLHWYQFVTSTFGWCQTISVTFCIGHMLHINREIIVLTHFPAMSKIVALLVQLVFVIVHLLTQHNLKLHSD